MLKKLLAGGLGLGLLLGSLPTYAANTQSANFMVGYDLDSTSLTFCRVTGADGGPFGTWISGRYPIVTVNSSVTTDEVTDTDPFGPVLINDVLQVDLGTGSQNVLVRTIATRASASQITVSTAWNIDNSDAGYLFTWKKTTCGTTAADGWIDVSGWDQVGIAFSIEQVNATGGIDVQMQCKTGAVNAQPIQVFPSCTTGACNTFQNYTAATIASTTYAVGSEGYAQCRLGVKINSADDGGDLTTNAERLNGELYLSKPTSVR